MNVALVAPTDRSIWTFRRKLISSLIGRGDTVTVICSRGEYMNHIKQLGAICISVKFGRFMNPVTDLRYLITLLNIFRKNKFDLVHCFTIKPNIFGVLAAKLFRARQVVTLVEGLGFAYREDHGLIAWISRKVVLWLYWLSCTLANKVWFINRDDLDLFLSSKIIHKCKAVFIRSVGVDSDEYCIESVDPLQQAQLRKELWNKRSYVTMVGRMIWSKGVREFVDAAAILEPRFPDVQFLLVGEIQDGSPLSVPREYLENEVGSNLKWLDFRQDVKDILAISDIVVLPSYYREGVPRSLLEAMAMAKPIVTTDSVGCREVVKNGENGYLVPIKDSSALADAISKLLDNPKKRTDFGSNGRLWVEKELDEKIVVERVLQELYGIE